MSEHDALINDTTETLRYMIANDMDDLPQYGLLDQARSGLLSEPPGTPRYASQQAVAEAQMREVERIRAAEAAQDPSSDPDFAAACTDCQPGEPCCLRAYEVSDVSDPSRKVVWPVPTDGPNRLYVVTDEAFQGSPSAKVKVELTDKQSCQRFTPGSPYVRTTGQADGPDQIIASGEQTVTSPFQIPAFVSSVLPPEIMTVIYVLGAFLQMSTYRNLQPVMTRPFQTMLMGGPGLEVFPLPKVDVSCSLTGKVEVMFSLTELPSLGAGITAEASGQVGNTDLTWSTSNEVFSRQRTGPPPQGPVGHTLIDFFESIQAAMDPFSREGQRTDAPPMVQARKAPFTMKFALEGSISVPRVALEGMSGSPNLQLTVNPFAMSLGPSVTATADLVQLMLSRIPQGREIYAAMSNTDNVLSGSASCSITISGGGTVGFSVEDLISLELKRDAELADALGDIRTIFSATCNLTGQIAASARLDVRTWFFDASATAGASISTGWQFGGRVTNNGDGTKKWERMHFFQGITLKAYARVAFGSSVSNSDTDIDPLADPLATIETGTRSTDAFSAQTTVAESDDADWTAVLMRADGDKDHWYDA